jgi:hypothetical protein
MSWPASFTVGALTGALGLVLSGVIATACVRWYQVSNVDLQSVAFVASITIIGGVVAFLIGLITTRVMPDPGFLKSLGVANGILLMLAGSIAGTARLLADVPPEIDGETLNLAVELRWPASQTTSPAVPGEPTLVLGSVTRMSHTQRAKSSGPLWMDQVKLIDGRWVAPGAVDIFTTRGNLTLTAYLDSTTNAGFLIPLHGSPSKKDFEWTEWYPHARPGAPPLPDGFQYRYRVQKRSEPVRTETFGPFDVQTSAYYFFDESVEGKTVLATMGEFAIDYRGERVTVDGRNSDSSTTSAKLDHADGVAIFGGSTPGLLAHFTSREGGDACYVVAEVGGQLQTTYVPDCATANGSILTTDSATFRQGERKVPRGRVNRIAFETPGLYSVGRAVVDTRRMAVHVYSNGPEMFSSFPAVPPLGISPDQRSFVRFGSVYTGENRTSIAVTDFVANRSYALPVDEARMRYPNLSALDPAWLMHHFEWKKDANGIDSLIERASFVPLPYGFRFVGVSGYWLEPGKQPLRDVLIDFIVKEFNGERVPVESYAYEYPVKIGNDTVNVAYNDTGHYVSLSLPHGAATPTPPPLLEAIAKRFGAEVATGKYDLMFGK